MRIHRISLCGAIRHYVFAAGDRDGFTSPPYTGEKTFSEGIVAASVTAFLHRVIKMKRPRTYDLYLGYRRQPTMTKVYRELSPGGQQQIRGEAGAFDEIERREGPSLPAYN